MADLGAPDLDAAQRMWQEFCAATGADTASFGAVEAFGDSAEMADELLALVLAGTKRATAGPVADFARAAEPLPEVGGHWIVVDGQGAPRCVLRTTEVRVGPLDGVDEAFAWDEGEGDRTRDWWLAAHRRFFRRQAERSGQPFDEAGEPVVFERFDLVWPRAVEVPAVPSLATIAQWLAGAVDEAERFRIVLEFVGAWREEDLAGDEREGLLTDEPAPSGDLRWDALLAALAEHLARSASLIAPSWVLRPERFLDRPFFPITHRSVRTAALVSSPAAFRRRGVFLDPESLATV